MSPGTREETVQGLRALADFLESHPDLPLYNVEASPYITGTDEQERAEVDRIAAILGQAAALDSGTHYRVSRDFGGGVEYKAVAIAEAEMDAWSAYTAAYDGPSRQRHAGGDGR